MDSLAIKIKYFGNKLLVPLQRVKIADNQLYMKIIKQNESNHS